MNIQQAKTEIARTFRAYTRRGADGVHRIPPEKQRPVLLIGPPGIGKTAIMKQIAGETGCGLVAYSMTHHTRQSAIGLPYISQKEYGGRTVSVTEYTMSEIVASLYDYMQRTGKRQGILFLDEINCVSETLAPVMLQLLQNKTFGNVPLPEDWIIVAAGNPPEYNKSVRDFDMVTLDRVKNIDVEADLDIWQEYARAQGVHPAVRTYLAVYPDHFYRIADTDRGQFFVTARGWEDLSLMLGAYEEEGIRVGVDWFLQYLQYDEIARSFGFYYDLFRHFTEDMAVELPEGKAFSLTGLLLGAPERLKMLTSTECLALASMLLHPILLEADRISEERKRLARQRALAAQLPADGPSEEACREYFSQRYRTVETKRDNHTMKVEEVLREQAALMRLEADVAAWRKLPVGDRIGFGAFESARIEAAENTLERDAQSASAAIEDAYRALGLCPQGTSARLYLANDVAASPACGEILEKYPSPAHKAAIEECQMGNG